MRKRRNRKIIPLLIAAVFVAILMPMSAISGFAGTTEDGFSYSISDGGATITGYTGSETDIVIPGYIGEYPVIAIGSNVFRNNSNLVSVDLSNCAKLKTIDNEAFSYCTNLQSIDFSGCSSLAAIYSNVFSSSTNIKTVYITDIANWCKINFSSKNSNPLYSEADLYLNGEIVTDLVIPEGITVIPAHAFYGCRSITSVTFPESIVKIERNAFDSCPNLKAVDFSSCDNLVQINSNAFNSCSQLKGVDLSDCSALTTISSGAFSNCSNLESVDLSNCNELRTIDGDAFRYGYMLRRADLSGCVNLESIGRYVFYSCSNLVSVDLSNCAKLKTIDSEAFSYCTNLQSIDFSGCSSLTAIYSNVFESSTNIKTVYITDIANWCKINFSSKNSNPLYSEADLYLNGEIVTDLVIPEGITVIPAFAFYGCRSITSVTFPESIVKIESNAFDSCPNLKAVDFSSCDDLVYINNYAFNRCSQLKGVDLSDCSALTTIGSGAFSSCSNLESVDLSNCNELRTIDGEAFRAGYMLRRADLSGCVNLESIGRYVFYSCSNLVSVDLSNCAKIKTIDSEAFSHCTNLQSIDFSGCSSLAAIYSNVFESSTNIRTVYITDIANWCKINFSSKYSNPLYSEADLYLNGEIVTDLVIPDGITVIPAYAFYGCRSITSVIFHESINSIGQYAFYSCPNLKDVWYFGTADQWTGVSVGSYNESITNAEKHYETDIIAYLHKECTGEQYFEYECADGHKLVVKIPGIGGHVPGVEATCTTDQLCVICGEIVIKALGHTVSAPIITEPTCIENGSVVNYCSACGECISHTTVNATGHVYSDENGTECIVCGDGKPVQPEQPGQPVTMGDLNGDGAVNGKDALLLAQFLAGAIGGF